MKYKRVVASRRGGTEVLRVIEDDLNELHENELRIKIIAAGVSFADILMREGVYMGMPKFPFSPGFDIVGVVETTGKSVTRFHEGDRVAALTQTGGYSEYIILDENEPIPLPEGLNFAEAVSLILNYVTAYQMVHREAKVQKGDRILIHGAAGGVGTALLQIGQLAGAEMFGTASASKHSILSSFGCIPIDYKNEDFARTIKKLTKTGVDFVFDGTGRSVYRSYRTLGKSGKLILYGISSMLKNGKRNYKGIFSTYLNFSVFHKNILPGDKKVCLYQITKYKKKHPDWFENDLSTLFQLLKQKKLTPVIANILPLDQAELSHQLLSASSVIGKIILSCNNEI